MSDQPLSGLRVLDLGTFIAAPFCATMLAEFGAEVIKVELPGSGDSMRTLGEERQGIPLFWLQESHNKHTITCNLRDPEGRKSSATWCGPATTSWSRTFVRERSSAGISAMKA